MVTKRVQNCPPDLVVAMFSVEEVTYAFERSIDYFHVKKGRLPFCNLGC